jgi:hypothetical protein
MRVGTTVLAVCTCLIVWIAGASHASSATRNIVLLFDKRLDFPELAAIDADLVRTLTSNPTEQIEVYREAMDLSRFGSDSYKMLLRDYLRAKLLDKKIDVAIAVMWPALDFLLSHGDVTFPGTQIVFGGIDRQQIGNRPLPPNVRGILVKREFEPTLELALSVHPQTERIVVVAGTSAFDIQILEEARKQFSAYENRLAFRYLTTLPLQKLLAELSQLPPRTIVLYTTLFRDGAGQPFIPHDAIERISAAARVPTYGFVDQYLGHGIVGGNLYSFADHGSALGKLALRVLAGTEPPGPSFSEVQTDRLLFDWRQMQRWGIGVTSLPSGSEIRFRDPSAWEQYSNQILTISAAIVLQAALITGDPRWHGSPGRRSARRADRPAQPPHHRHLCTNSTNRSAKPRFQDRTLSGGRQS